jgi:hypothetical protein
LGNPRIIAFYLPQFHPIPENNEWWGKGFTEWYNVGKAKALFPGHRQPKVPTDLGYYDLRVPEIRLEQSRLAKEAGVEGFCYWHYWFGNGKRLLEKPIEEVVKTGQPDFPFCLAWANETWKAKLWNKDSKKDRLLIEQEYGGIEDYTQHFYTILPILRDRRYIKVDNKCLFMIYRPKAFNDCALFIQTWQRLAVKNGLDGIHFVAHADPWEKKYSLYFNKGFDAVYTHRIFYGATALKSYNIGQITKYIFFLMLRLPRIVNFKTIIKQCYNQDDFNENYYPGIICNWDHSPRSGRNGYVFTNFNRTTFSDHVRKQLSLVRDKDNERSIVFLKSWNEWGEGNFMEPDIEYKMMKIEVLGSELRNNGDCN